MTSTLKTTRPGCAAVARRVRCVALALLVGLASPAAPVAAQDHEQGRSVETHHQIVVGGQTLKYTARAGLLPIRDNEAGEIHAHIFFMAYLLDTPTKQPSRPLTFVWNGGPGMNSSLIHLLGFGPRRVRTGDTYPGSPPPSETEMEDNQETWLDQTDSYSSTPSAPVQQADEGQVRKRVLSNRGDSSGHRVHPGVTGPLRRVELAALHRRPQLRNDTGHGRRRRARERRGITLSGGAALMSGGLTVGQGPLSPELSTALAVPGMTAAAFFHKKLPAISAQSREHAEGGRGVGANRIRAGALEAQCAERRGARRNSRGAVAFHRARCRHAGSRHARRRKGSVQDSTAPR